MRSWPVTAATTSTAETKAKEATETTILTLPAISTQNPNTKVIFDCTLVVLTGKEATGLVARIRRGTLTGTEIVKFAEVAQGAEKQVSISLNGEDEPGEVAGLAYLVTLVATASKGESTMKYVSANVSY